MRIAWRSRISSASTAGSAEPIASAPICQNWRKRPACGFSWRKKLDRYQSFTGCGALCMPCSRYARATGAVPSGPQRLRPPAGVLEGVHLLLDDVGRLADAAGEQLGRLEGRRLDAAVAGGLEDALGDGLDARRAGQSSGSTSDVPRGAWIRSLTARARPGRGSSPSPGRGWWCPCGPGRTSVSSGQRSSSVAIESSSVWWSPLGRSVRPTEFWNSTSPEAMTPSSGNDVRHVALGVARRRHDLDPQARELQRLAALDGLVGLVALVRADALDRDVPHDVGEAVDLELRAVHGRARRLRERRDRADVVDVRVGDEDRLDGRAELLDRVEQLLAVVAGVDHDRAVGAVARAARSVFSWNGPTV